MIEAKNLNKRFGKLQALRNLSFRFSKGECIALIGPNGCGKTTLIKTILGMVVPDSGHILFDGKDIQGQFAYRAQIGYMPQTGRYPEAATIAQVIKMMKDLRGKDARLDESLIHSFQLETLGNKRTGTLSGGTRQKLSAALAFLFSPDVLILDEPTAGLDPVSSEVLKQKILEEKEKGRLILITSHILSELDELVTEVVFMQEGELRFHAPMAQLQEQTGELRLSKVIARIMQQQTSQPPVAR
ncbi:MAG: ABC transporter ATP-binding protein [Bacteroidetes bacterium]|nr:ABC transporter ATP-binding protein [Bacteroidota bacterium]MBS1630033.1 ABC transporter ATP-binding protein [Bacteroidota bacterium]